MSLGSIKKIRKHNIIILNVFQDITVYKIGEFRRLLDEIKNDRRKEKNVIIDFREVAFLDPLVLGIFAMFSKVIREDGGEVKIAGMIGEVRDLFERTKLSVIYEMFDTTEKAVKSYES